MKNIWPYNRKDMTIYGKSGYVFCKNGRDMEILVSGKSDTVSQQAKPLPQGQDDPFSFLANVIRHRAAVTPFGLSSLDNNIIAMKILDAARHAAQTGQTVVWERDEASQF